MTWLRNKLWYFATLIGLSVVLGWFLGSWQTGWSVVVWLVLVSCAVVFLGLIWAGWVELKEGRNADDD